MHAITGIIVIKRFWFTNTGILMSPDLPVLHVKV